MLFPDDWKAMKILCNKWSSKWILFDDLICKIPTWYLLLFQKDDCHFIKAVTTSGEIYCCDDRQCLRTILGLWIRNNLYKVQQKSEEKKTHISVYFHCKNGCKTKIYFKNILQVHEAWKCIFADAHLRNKKNH